MEEIASIPPEQKPDLASGYPSLTEIRRELSKLETVDRVFNWITVRIKPQMHVFAFLRYFSQEISTESFHDPRLVNPLSPPQLYFQNPEELEAYLVSNPPVVIALNQSRALYPQSLKDLPSQLRCEALILAPLLQNQNLIGFLIIGGFQKETPLEFFSDKTMLYITSLVEIISLTIERLDALDVAKRYEAMLQLLDKDNNQKKSEYERMANEISSKLWASMDMESLLKITLQDLALLLKASQGIIQLENIHAER
jgi:transcriptional regulator with GAF, ATPase, and Fis domain